MEMRGPLKGWNSWNTFGANINDALIRESAEAVAKSGLKDAGYDYIVIDDCWSLKDRDADGRLVADPALFPHGMKDLADYIHSLGFKFGMYSCVGTKTCAGYPGSFGHEFQDAQTFADWGVDFLKYDYCYKPDSIDGRLLYNRMSMALKATGRDIVFSACSWGADDTAKWIRSTGADMWRSTGDIVDSWASVKSLFGQQRDILPYGGPGCYNDMDMLIVGMNGKGNVGINGCTLEEYRTHFTLWAFLSSPLMLGCDVRTMEDPIRDMLTNREVLAHPCGCEVPAFSGHQVYVGGRHPRLGQTAFGRRLRSLVREYDRQRPAHQHQLVGSGSSARLRVCLCRAGCLGRGGSRRIRGGLPALGQAA